MSAVTSVKIVGPIKLPCSYPGTCLSSIKSSKQITIALENEGVQISSLFAAIPACWFHLLLRVREGARFYFIIHVLI